jgi:hypothetical protein
MNTYTETKADDPKSLIKIGEPNKYLASLSPSTPRFLRLFCPYSGTCVSAFTISSNSCMSCTSLLLVSFFYHSKVVVKAFFLCVFHFEALIAELSLVLIYLGIEIYLR